MKQIYCILIMFSLLLGCSPSDSKIEQVQQQAQILMQKYERGEFRSGPTPQGTGGPYFGEVNGRKLVRDDLYYQAEPIIDLGPSAVPELIKWLKNDHAYMRFIASHSLKRITGEAPTFYYFGKPGEPFNGDSEWFDKAVKAWLTWYDNQ